ncbi:hypothetical protein F4809DRAFT_639883 [Biscogniauxia mediterranea]|nr:hypothetical protein F4809DRAFT_639883 [Biscogniauxia mediterranea]
MSGFDIADPARVSEIDKELKYYQQSYELNLKRLLLPLLVDDELAERLIKEPGGPAWAAPAIADALEERHSKSHTLYMGITQEMERVMNELTKELALGTEAVETCGPYAMTYPIVIDFRLGESTRKRFFGELQVYNDQLSNLLSASDVVSNLQTKRSTTAKGAVDAAMCKFWYHADRLYKAILDAWGYSCRDQHCARLMLQHRTSPEPKFRLLVSSSNKLPSNARSNQWIKCQIRAEEQEIGHIQGLGSGKAESSPLPRSLPQHRITSPARTAMPGNRDKCVLSKSSSQTVETMSVHDAGYVEESDRRYYLYPEVNPSTTAERHISLARMILEDSLIPFTRRQRYYVALVLASSFVQLKDTRWISSLHKSNVEFLHDGVDAASIIHPDQLYPDAGNNDDLEVAFNQLAALEWLKEVNDEAGEDYFNAIEWYLTGCRKFSNKTS